MSAGGKKAPIRSKQPRDQDAETIAKYRVLEERNVAELRQVRLVIRRAQQRRAWRQARARQLRSLS